MAQNPIPPELQKLMAQMPNVGNMGVPADLGLGVTPTLSVPNAEPPTGDPSLSRVDRFFEETIPSAVGSINEFFSPLDSVASNYGKRAEAGRATHAAGATEAFRGLGAAKDVLLKEGSPSFGEAFEARGGRVDANLPQPKVPMATPGSVAGLSITGTPLTPDAITSPSIEFPQTPAPAPAQSQVPNIGGTITRDATGQVFSSTQQGNALINSPMTQTPAQTQQMAQDTQAGIDASRAAYEQRAAAANPAQVAGETPIGYGDTVQANIAAGRPANVSAGEVQVAQRQALQREAEATADRAAEAFRDEVGYVGANGRSIAQTDDAVAQVRAAALSEAMGKIDPNAVGGAGSQGLTFDQQLALSKEERAGREEARDVAAADTEARTAKQEMETKETDLYNLHQDSFDRQERYINQALKNTGLLSTGFASISKFAPGTPARQLEESLKPILGEAAFGRLQQMRDASKTGGALGQVSERELGLLESAMGALSTSQNESQFRANLLAYRKQMRESHARIQEAYKGKSAGGSSGRPAPRYKDDVNTSQSLDDILLPTSK